jgi:hypothetical protein
MTQRLLSPGKTLVKAGIRSLLKPVRALLTSRVAGSCARVLALGSMSIALGAALIGQGAPPAFAIQAKPPTYLSYYIHSSSTGEAYTLGKNLGSAEASHGQNSAVILDFGGQTPDGSGTLTINGINLTNSQIEQIAEAFSHGFKDGIGKATWVLRLAIGTNNSYGDVSSAGGKQWVDDASAIQSYNKSHSYYPQVLMYGGSDIESWCGSSVGCKSPSAAINWAKGFNDGSGIAYVNYGSADGCPETSSNNGSCSGGWNQYDYWFVSYDGGVARPTPEIYVQAQADQWAMISLYGAQHQGKRLSVWGPLDEYPLDTSTFTAQQAWNALWTALNSNSATAQNLSYSLEITNEP